MLGLWLIPIGLYRIYEVLGGKDNYVMVNIGMTCMNLNGFMNCLKYSTTDTVKSALKQKLCNNRADSQNTNIGTNIQSDSLCVNYEDF